jgi:hypothetical protein
VARKLVALALLVAFAGIARAEDFKWDPKKKAKPVEGAKSFAESSDSDKQSVRVTIGGKVAQKQDKETKTSFRALTEVVKVTDGKRTEAKVKLEKWKQTTGDEEDSCLEGKTIIIKGTGADTTWELKEKDVEVSDGATKWIEKELAKKEKPDEDALDKAAYPQKPIGDGDEWDGDAKAFAEALFKGQLEVDGEKSTFKGKLTNVHVEDGVHFGHVELKATFAMKKSDQFSEGGTITMTVVSDMSLEKDKRDGETSKLEFKLEAKGEQETPQGTATVKLKVESKREQKEGPLKD